MRSGEPVLVTRYDRLHRVAARGAPGVGCGGMVISDPDVLVWEHFFSSLGLRSPTFIR